MLLDHITVDLDVLDGLPHADQTLVPVAVVCALSAAGMAADEIVGAFRGLSHAGVHQALTLPVWMVLPPGGLTAGQYDALPEEVCKWIEVVDGAVVARA